MPNLHRRDYKDWWFPNADQTTAPGTALLRADNLVPDEGMPSLRRGSTKINTTAVVGGSSIPESPQQINTLFTANLGGTRIRLAGANDGRVHKIETTPQPLDAFFTGSGDYAMGAAMGRILISRGTTHKDYDATEYTNWSIAAPSVAPTVSVVDPFTKIVATCNSAEAPGFTAEEGTITGTYPTGEDGTANGAIEVTPASATGRATIIKTYSAAEDYFNINGYTGSPFDLFDLPIWVTEPEKVETVTVMFGLSTTTDKFQTDYYYFDFKLGGQRQQVVDIQNGVTQAVEETVKNTAKRRKRNGDEEEIDVDERRRLQDQLEQRREDRRRERKDKASNPGWTHLACLRSQFNRVGSTSTLSWETVSAFKIVYKAVAGSSGTVRFDNIKFHGGGNEKALTGKFKVVYRYARDCGDFYKVSPPSPESEEVTLNTQAVEASIPLAAAGAMDSQVDEVWFYIFGGVLDRYYRTQNTVDAGALSANGFKRTIRSHEYDETAQNESTAADRTRRCTFGYAIPQTPGQVAASVDILANQADLLIANEYLEIGTSAPPDDVIGIVGDHHFRLFCLTEKKLIPSLPRNPCSLLPGRAIAVGSDDETAYWVAKTIGGLYVGTSEDIYHIQGDGQEFLDGTLNLSRVSLNIAFPPKSRAFALEGNQILYLAADGWRAFNGETSTPIHREAIDLLYQGQTRHGVSPVNLSTGTFRAALSNGVMCAITPEGASTTSSTALHRYDSNRQIWRRDTYPFDMTAIHREPDGGVIFGDEDGFVRQLDSGTQDDATDIAVVLWTKSDDNDAPLTRKDPFDETVRLDTGGANATVALHLDGSSSSATSYTAAATGMGVYKKALKTADDSGVSAFRRIQHRITGSFSTFKLFDFNLAYRERPQGRMFVDTGYIDFGHQDLVWIREVMLKVDSPNNLTVKVWMDDVLAATKTVTVTANAMRPYTVSLGREVKGYQPRITIETTNSAGTGNVDFEIEWLKIRFRPSGNITQKPYRVTLPGQQEVA